jgi:phospholipid transport system substrate-binding protein
MKPSTFFRICLLLVTIIAPLSSQKTADASDPADKAIDVVQRLAIDIWSVPTAAAASERQRFLASAIEARTNVNLLGRLALGRYWREFDDVMRQDYEDLFSRVIIADLAGRLDTLIGGLDGSLDEHFRITSGVNSGKRDVVVRSKVLVDDGRSLSVDWRLRAIDEHPVIIDLVVEGVSLLVTQRAEFSSVIERHQPEGLIAALRSRARATNF